MRIKRFSGLGAALAVAMSLAACAGNDGHSAQAASERPADALLEIRAAPPAPNAIARVDVWLDGRARGVLAPGCALVLPVPHGAHRLEVSWPSGGWGEDLTLTEGQHMVMQLGADGRVASQTVSAVQPGSCGPDGAVE